MSFQKGNTLGGNRKGKKHSEESKLLISKKTKEAMDNLDVKLKCSKGGLKTGRLNLGRKHTVEAKKNMSLSHMGANFTKEHKENISKGNLGRFVSEETKQKCKESNLETWGNMSQERLDKHSAKMSKNKKKWWDSLSEEDRKIQLDKMLNSSNKNKRFRETGIELKIKEQLEMNDISYRYQYYRYDKENKKRFFFDFYLPDYKLVIEANGDYWHSLPDMIERDKLKEQFILRTNHKILWLWEHEINKKDFNVILHLDKIEKEVM